MPPHPDENLYPGQTLSGRWRIDQKCGEGHFGIVYHATDITASKRVAVKVLSIQHHGDQHAVREFQREGALLSVLADRSHVIETLDAGVSHINVTVNGLSVPLPVYFIVLALASTDLETVIVNRSVIPWSDRLSLFRDVTKGMHQAHLSRVVHRDLKSSNVLIVELGSEQRACISDFGRGRDTRSPAMHPAQAYETGRGDFRFAPPESLWGIGDGVPESMAYGDLYLLGSLLFELATGVGITAVAFPNPGAVVSRFATLSFADRDADFRSMRADIRDQYEPAYEMFRYELPPSLRQLLLALLRQLTDVDPPKRAPISLPGRSVLPRLWDLQWVIRRVDRATLVLAHANPAGNPQRRRSAR